MTDVVLCVCGFSVVSRFLELLTLQVLHSGSDAPSGLQFHILDLYMVELAGVASTEVGHAHIPVLLVTDNLTLSYPIVLHNIAQVVRILMALSV